MAFGAIFRLRVVRWLLVLRDARLRVGQIGGEQAELGRPRGLDSTMVSDTLYSKVPWYTRGAYTVLYQRHQLPKYRSARLGPWQ